MADNAEDKIFSISASYEKYFLGSGDDEEEDAEEPKQEKENADNEEDEKELTSLEESKSASEPPIHTLEQLANSDFIRNRQLAAKSIVEYLNQAGSDKEALHSVISIMCKLTEDEDLMVRSELMDHIPAIAMFCKEHSDDLNVVIRQQIVPYTVKLLTDTQRQIRKIGHATLLVLLENSIIDYSQLSEWICPLIAQLATSESTPHELRLEDVTVMCKMIPYVGKQITEKLFLDPFLSLLNDSSISIIEVCMQNFGTISRVIGTESTETSLLPAFLDLCERFSSTIKSKCVDIAVQLASVVSPTTRNEILSHVYISFLKNPSRAVSYDASQSLGKFISTFADPSKTGLNYSDGVWVRTPYEDDFEDLLKNENYFEHLTSEIISNPQLLDECSFKNLNSCLLDCGSSDEDLSHAALALETDNLNFGVIMFDSTELSFDYRSNRTQPLSVSVSSSDDKPNNFNDKSEESDQQSVFLLNRKTHSDDRLPCVDNENNFNNFQYWRTPLPEIELDIDIENSKLTNANTIVQIEDLVHSFAEELKKKAPAEDIKDPDKTLPEADFDVKRNEDSEKVSSLEKRRYFNNSFQRMMCWEIKKKKRLEDKLNNHVVKKEIQITDKEKLIYEQDIVPPELLTEFLNLCNDVRDVRENVAYHLPSVAYTLGRKYWPCLRSMFQMLAVDETFKVRRIIASSLHDMAIVLGQAITTEDLLPVFMQMLRDPNVLSHSSLLPNLSHFLKRLKPDARRQFLPLIQRVCAWDDEDSNWRYRYTVAEQFIPCIELFSSSEALHFLPVPLLLLQDKVSAVRNSAVELLAVIIKSMITNSKSSDFLKAVLSALDEKYRKANKWLWRQIYVYICQELAVKKSLPTEFYVEEIVPNLFSLAWDTVPNVRLAVARCLGLTLLPLNYLPSIQKAHYQLLLQVMYSLQSDVDKDVRHFAHLSAAAFNVLPPKKESPGSQFNKCEEWWEKSD